MSYYCIRGSAEQAATRGVNVASNPVVIGTGWDIMNWVAGPGDFDGNGCSDVIARDSAGQLLLYKGNCGTGGDWWSDVAGICCHRPGWNAFNWMVGPGDFNGDGCADLITRRADNGTLRLYNGNCAGGFGAGAGAVIGTGWNAFNSIVGPGDFQRRRVHGPDPPPHR